jgi:DNA-binding response OmpR family regulator
MTANAMAVDRKAALEAGMNDHVAKPFDFVNLVEVIARHVRVEPEAGPGAAGVRSRTAGAESAIDVEGALARFGDASDIYARALKSFVIEAPRLLERIVLLAGKAAAADAREIKLQLHSLKGASAQVGADQLAGLLARAEKVPYDSLEPWLPEIASLARDTIEAAHTVAARLTPGSDTARISAE